MQDIAALQEELNYYKKLADKHAGDSINSQYTLAQLSNESKQLLNVFHIIADLHRSFNYLMQPAEFHEIVLESLLSKMSLNQVMLLKIKDEYTLQPFHSKGFANNGTDCSLINLSLPSDFFLAKKPIIRNNLSLNTEAELWIAEQLNIPYFIITPLVNENVVYGALFAGRQSEMKPLSYLPFTISDINTFESIAGMISSLSLQLEHREKIDRERNRIARDMHDEVGAELSRISLQASIIKQNESYPEIRKSLDVIQHSADTVIDNIGNIIWALNPVNNSINNLIRYLREYSFEYLEPNGISLEFHAIPLETDHPMHAEVRNHLFMVIKEILHNIIKHASCNKVKMNISINALQLKCSIQDNGTGFDRNCIRSFGNGLRNMNQRIHEAGGTIIMESDAQGTSFQLSVPI